MLENGGSVLGHHFQQRLIFRLGLDDIIVSASHKYSKMFDTALCYNQLDLTSSCQPGVGLKN
eukprot:3219238-Pyramimonas_sp.AAC.1